MTAVWILLGMACGIVCAYEGYRFGYVRGYRDCAVSTMRALGTVEIVEVADCQCEACKRGRRELLQ